MTIIKSKTIKTTMAYLLVVGLCTYPTQTNTFLSKKTVMGLVTVTAIVVAACLLIEKYENDSSDSKAKRNVKKFKLKAKRAAESVEDFLVDNDIVTVNKKDKQAREKAKLKRKAKRSFQNAKSTILDFVDNTIDFFKGCYYWAKDTYTSAFQQKKQRRSRRLRKRKKRYRA